LNGSLHLVKIKLNFRNDLFFNLFSFCILQRNLQFSVPVRLEETNQMLKIGCVTNLDKFTLVELEISGLVLGQFLLLPQLPQKMTIASKSGQQ